MDWLSRGTPERDTMNKWKMIHSYQRIVEANLAEPVACPDDGQTLVSLIDTVDDTNEDPVMWCPVCDSRYHLGIDAWDQIEATVRDLWNPTWQ